MENTPYRTTEVYRLEVKMDVEKKNVQEKDRMVDIAFGMCQRQLRMQVFGQRRK